MFRALLRCFSYLGAWALLAACTQNAPTPASALAATPTAKSDGWVSSGGDLIGDRNNPWWVNNTVEVSYCIAIDQATVTADANQIEKTFQEVTKWWKREFSDFHAFYGPRQSEGPRREAQVAQQRFHRVECTENPQLRLLFGSGLLTREEREFLKDPASIISRAVRTGYSSKSLQGTGFIYFASETGEDALLKRMLPRRMPLPENLKGALWSRVEWLTLALLHEMGHAFGVPHLEGTFMAERYLDRRAEGLQADNSDDRSVLDRVPPLFAPFPLIPFYTMSLPKEGMQALTGKKFEGGCQLEYHPPSVPDRIETEAFARIDCGGAENPVRFTLEHFTLQSSFQPRVYLRLTNEQEVFAIAGSPEKSFLEKLGRNDLRLGGTVSYKGYAELWGNGGRPIQEVQFHINPTQYQALSLTGVVNGRAETVIETNLYRRAE